MFKCNLNIKWEGGVPILVKGLKKIEKGSFQLSFFLKEDRMKRNILCLRRNLGKGEEIFFKGGILKLIEKETLLWGWKEIKGFQNKLNTKGVRLCLVKQATWDE